ncbi:MAG: ABC transporter ATP-binding protein [Deltaproteobacteria bacterium]|nr:ABC transporter ATP-binding protein [Deltaproteobacteria bacterium]
MLEVKDLSVRYGDAHVITGVSFQAARGAITCILGPNGSGKTTLLRCITGLVSPASGRIMFDGQNLQGKKPHEIVRMGLIMIPEGRRLWPPLTVEENLKMGAYLVNEQARIDGQLSYVFDLFPHLGSRKNQLCGTLSGGELQMVAIGRGLMGFPRLLLLDEPSLGLAPLVVREVFRAVEKIVDAGTTVLLVEQNTQVALSVAVYGYILEIGSIALESDAASLRENSHVKEAYLGL